jgi:membrane protease YdiL (CAAX protease family)
MHDTAPIKPAHPRRVLVRVALFWVCTLAILLGVGMLRFLVPAPVRALAWGLASSLAIAALTWAYLQWEGRDAGSVGLRLQRGSWPRFVLGIAMGLALYAVYLALVTIVTGSVRLVPAAGVDARATALAIATYLALSSMEELGFRGYPLRRLEERIGRLSALGIGAVAFGLLHLAYGWSLSTAMVGAVAGGFLFGMAALVSRGLALPIGLHAAWNIAGWAVGEKGGTGIWRLVAEDQAVPYAATAGALGFVGVMASAAIAFWISTVAVPGEPPPMRAASLLAAAKTSRLDDILLKAPPEVLCRPPQVNDHGEENPTTSEPTPDDAIPDRVRALVSAESRADAGPVRLDHTYRPRQLGSGGDEGLVRQGAGLDVQAELPDAGR